MFLYILEIIGTIAFAIGGSVLAIKNKMDILGVIILAIVSALGGGLIRDVIINSESIVLFSQPIYIIVSIITALVVFVIFYGSKRIDLFDNKYFNFFLNVIDGIGLGVFVVVGAQVAYGVTENLLLIIFCALSTGIGGGIIRDLMVNRIPNIFRKHIYAMAALLGLIIYMICSYYDIAVLGSVICIIVVTLIRIVSQHFKLSLPKVEVGDEVESITNCNKR